MIKECPIACSLFRFSISLGKNFNAEYGVWKKRKKDYFHVSFQLQYFQKHVEFLYIKKYFSYIRHFLK